MITYLGSFVQLCCGKGGTLQTDITGMCGECSQCIDHTGFAPAQGGMYFLGSTQLRLQGPLQGHCPKQTLCFVHFPGLSCSDSRVFCKSTNLAGHVLCTLARSEQLRRPGAW